MTRYSVKKTITITKEQDIWLKKQKGKFKLSRFVQDKLEEKMQRDE